MSQSLEIGRLASPLHVGRPDAATWTVLRKVDGVVVEVIGPFGSEASASRWMGAEALSTFDSLRLTDAPAPQQRPGR